MTITEQLYEALVELDKTFDFGAPFEVSGGGYSFGDTSFVNDAFAKAQAALAAHEASKDEPAASLLWCCHVRGPDDVHPAPDYQTALKWSDMINDWSDKANAKFKDEEKVMSKAAPALWPWSPESHAWNLAKTIADFSPRNPLSRAVPTEPLTKGNI